MGFFCSFSLHVLGATGLALHIKIGSKRFCFTHIPAAPQCVECRGKRCPVSRPWCPSAWPVLLCRNWGKVAPAAGMFQKGTGCGRQGLSPAVSHPPRDTHLPQVHQKSVLPLGWKMCLSPAVCEALSFFKKISSQATNALSVFLFTHFLQCSHCPDWFTRCPSRVF